MSNEISPLKFKVAKNLVVHAVEDGYPWDWTEEKPDSPTDQVKIWLRTPAASWQVYCPYVGVNPNQKISSSDNFAARCRGLVADIDDLLTRDQMHEIAAGLGEKIRPTLLQRTFTRDDAGRSRWRLVWIFERELLLAGGDNKDFATLWAAAMLEGIFAPLNRIKGFDAKAWKNPSLFYISTNEWEQFGEDSIDHDWLVGVTCQIQDKAARDARPKAEVEVPLDVVHHMLAERYPSFLDKWGDIDWKTGAQGPTFWIPESTSPMSAIVYPTGMRTFSAHATQPFYSWPTLLGAENLKEYVARARGATCNDVFFDNVSFWRQSDDGRWRPHKRENLLLWLRGKGYSRKLAEEANLSALEEAVRDITDKNLVDYARPELFKPAGFYVSDRGLRCLNTSNCKVLQPADELTPWGPEGRFPWMSQFLETFFDPSEKQLEVFLCWWQWFYGTALAGDLRPGQVLVFGGPPNCGKTLISHTMIAESVGGMADANSYLSNRTDFNSELFQYPLWGVDDTSLPTTDHARRKFTDQLKRVAANYQHKCNPKFEKATDVSWLGRVLVNQNIDSESLTQLPDLSASSMDKIVMLRCSKREEGYFPGRSELAAIIRSELPYFLRWLVSEFKTDLRKEGHRFGMESYHHPDLFVHACTSSSASVFYALFTSFLWAYCKPDDKDELPSIHGNALAIWEQMHNFPGTKEALKSAKVTYLDLQHHLERLVDGDTENATLEATATDGNNPEYTITVKP